MKTDQKDPHRYDDMIYLPRPVSVRPKMGALNRAAQFTPFAALNGYEEAIAETQRITDEKMELDENEKMRLDLKLQKILEQANERPQIKLTYFVPDEKKSGGTYKSTCGIIRRVDPLMRSIIMDDGTMIQMEAVTEIEIESGA